MDFLVNVVLPPIGYLILTLGCLMVVLPLWAWLFEIGSNQPEERQ